MVDAAPERTDVAPRIDAAACHYVQCYVRQQAYGIAIAYVQEVVPLPELMTLPTSPEFLAGFVNIAGAAVPVVRMDRLLGLPANESTLYTPIVVLKGLDAPLALMVDRVHRVVKLDTQEIVRLSAGVTVNDFAVGVAKSADERLVVIDAEQLLLEQEAACLEALRASAQVRIHEAEVACA